MKKKLLLIFLFLIGCINFIFASGDGELFFSPGSGELVKLYCDKEIWVYASGSANVNGVAMNILFDSDKVTLTKQDYTKFTQILKNDIFTNHYLVSSSIATESGIFSLFSFKIKSITGAKFVELMFRDDNGTLNYGSPYLQLTDPDNNANNVLSNVRDATYYFYAEPCRNDGQPPKLLNNGIYSGSTKINNNTGISKNQQLNFVVYDGGGDKTNMHWFKGNGVVDYTGWNNFADYVAAPNDVDNQAGVNSGTIEVRVSCPTCTSSPSRTLTINNGLNTPVVWGGNTSNNRYTWDNKDRGYTVTFNNPFGYEIEKEVTMVVYANDNKGNRFTGSSITFNKKQDPVITLVTPTPLEEKVDNFDAINVPPSNTNPIVIGLSDEWAGIDTGSIEISISYPVLSGDSEDEYIMTGYTLSNFSEGDFVPVSGTPGTGNAGSYNLTFYPLEKFTVNTGITIVVTGSDLAGNTSVKTFKILTMNSCEAYGCSDLFYMRNEGFDLGKLSFTGGVVQITGNRLESGYPRFEKVGEFCDLETGEGCEEILMCGKDWNHVDVSVNGSVAVEGLDGGQYTGSVLYITGLDFEMSGNVIIISD